MGLQSERSKRFRLSLETRCCWPPPSRRWHIQPSWTLPVTTGAVPLTAAPPAACFSMATRPTWAAPPARTASASVVLRIKTLLSRNMGDKMNKIVVLAFVLLIFCCDTYSHAQDKVVVIPLFSEPKRTHEIPTVTTVTGRVWMDCNLGASKVAESIDDEHAYGWLYQWGRLSDGHQDRASPLSEWNATSDTDTPGRGEFIRTDSLPRDWRVPKNDNLWQGCMGINNPCPPGFRLPTVTEWYTEAQTWECPGPSTPARMCS